MFLGPWGFLGKLGPVAHPSSPLHFCGCAGPRMHVSHWQVRQLEVPLPLLSVPSASTALSLCDIIVGHTHFLPLPSHLHVLNTLLIKHDIDQADVFVAANHRPKSLSELPDPRIRLGERLPHRLFESINLSIASGTGGGRGLDVFT